MIATSAPEPTHVPRNLDSLSSTGKPPSTLVAEIDALRRAARAREGSEDLRHLRKLERWGKLCSLLGYGTAWLAPNPISAGLISQGIFTRWTTIAHAISHKAYDRVPGSPAHYTSQHFAKGWRRAVDWLDWIVPAAWHHEHDLLHHSHLGSSDDPDVLFTNTRWVRRLPLPARLRALVVLVLASIWKPAYYAPNTVKELFHAQQKRRDPSTPKPRMIRLATWNPMAPEGRLLWLHSYLPYVSFRFLLLPALALPLGQWAALSVFLNAAMAEIFTNLHSFLVIAPNHTGEDVPAFEGRALNRAEFYRRQIHGSVNYRCGSDGIDFLQGYLNYQIEHHVYPDLPLRQYAWVQPRLLAICRRHGIPYTQESVFTRMRKTLDVIVGRSPVLAPPVLASPDESTVLAN